MTTKIARRTMLRAGASTLALTAAALKKALRLSLTPEEEKLEAARRRAVHD